MPRIGDLMNALMLDLAADCLKKHRHELDDPCDYCGKDWPCPDVVISMTSAIDAARDTLKRTPPRVNT